MCKLYSYIILIVFMMISLSLKAHLALEKALAFQHLKEVNKQWVNYCDISPTLEIAFESDVDRIAFHLNHVIANLKTNTSVDLSDRQSENRAQLLNLLQTYSNSKQFPVNKYHPNRHPYFIDESGTHCAVGYLIAASGYSTLANEIKESYNYRYLLDMPEANLLPWATEFGFTIKELAWIQPGYSPTSILTEFPDGPNGPVTKLEHDLTNDQLIINGAFSEIGGVPCSQIGYYKNSSFHCLGSGLSGPVNDVSTNGADILAAGLFMYNGVSYPLARFESGTWVYYDIPGRSGAAGVQVFDGESGDKSGIIIQHSMIPGQEEIWIQDAANNWSKKLTATGTINDAAVTPDGWLFGGAFNTVTVHNQGQNDITIACNNLILKDLGTNNWQALGTEVSDNVNGIDIFDGVAYISGSCSNLQDVCVSTYENGTLTAYVGFQSSGFLPNYTSDVRSFLKTDDTHLFVGDFYHSFGLYHGNNLAYHHPIYGYMPGVSFDHPINQIIQYEGDIFIGGEFTYNYSMYGDSITYLAIYGSPISSVDAPIADTGIQIYPNPATNFVSVKGMASAYAYTIHDTSGRLLLSGTGRPDNQIDLSSLSDGVLLLAVWNESGRYSSKVVKSW